jgi:hypothetical protein
LLHFAAVYSREVPHHGSNVLRPGSRAGGAPLT